MRRIGLIGGMSWESTATYYRLLNEATAQELGPWHQPRVLIDSIDFSRLVALQRADDWTATGRLVAESARRLEAGGAEVLGICANTMHKNMHEVRAAVSVPVVDIRDALARAVTRLGASSVTLLGTSYVMEETFYVSHLEAAGLHVVTPGAAQIGVLQAIIYEELTQGIVAQASREQFIEIADDCRSRGGEVVGLCCTEFGLLIEPATAPWPMVDSTVAHVRALLDHAALPANPIEPAG